MRPDCDVLPRHHGDAEVQRLVERNTTLRYLLHVNMFMLLFGGPKNLVAQFKVCSQLSAHYRYILDDQRGELVVCLQFPAKTNLLSEHLGFVEEKANKLVWEGVAGDCPTELNRFPLWHHKRQDGWIDYWCSVIDFSVQWFPASSLDLTALDSGLSFTHSFTLSDTNGWLLPSMLLPAPCGASRGQCLVQGHWKRGQLEPGFEPSNHQFSAPFAQWTAAAPYLYMQTVVNQRLQKTNEWMCDIWHSISKYRQIHHLLIQHKPAACLPSTDSLLPPPLPRNVYSPHSASQVTSAPPPSPAEVALCRPPPSRTERAVRLPPAAAWAARQLRWPSPELDERSVGGRLKKGVVGVAVTLK